MTLKKPALLLAAAASAAAFAGPAASPAQANCATIMVGDDKFCLENVICNVRESAANTAPAAGPAIRKWVDNDYC